MRVQETLGGVLATDQCFSVSDHVTVFYLGEGEHVEVGHVIFMGAFDSLLALLGVDDLSHILTHKVTLEQTTKQIFTVF